MNQINAMSTLVKGWEQLMLKKMNVRGGIEIVGLVMVDKFSGVE